MQVDLALHAISRTIIGEPGDVDLADTTNSELEGITLPHAVDMTTLKPFAGRLWFRFDSNEKPVFLENPVNRSPGTREIELVLDPSGSPCRIFSFEPDDPLFQRYRDCPAGSFPWPGLLRFQPALGIFPMVLRPSSHGSFGDVVCLSDLFGTAYFLFVKYNCLCPYLHCRFHPQAPARCS